MQKFFWYSLLLTSAICISTTSCSVFNKREVASEIDSNLSQIFTEIKSANAFVDTNTIKCYKSYDSLFQKLFNITGNSTYYESNELKAIGASIQSAFETRIALKEAFKEFGIYNSDDQKCLNSAQNLFRSLRYVEDYLVELYVARTNSNQTEYINMEGQFPYFLVNPKYSNEFKSYNDLKSGDVILSRGNAYSSAAIARIAINDYQFSHISFVYRDQESKDLFTTEAHIEVGSITEPISYHINEKNARSAIFRYKNAGIAHKASKLIYDIVKEHQDSGKNIEYDFSMNYKDNSKLFCSEIISEGFQLAMPGSKYMPKFKSKFSKGMIPFVNVIGVPVNNENIDTLDVFAPGDIQFDPNFEIVAEWRNPKKLEETRSKDFILTKMFELMDKEKYFIDPSFKMDAQTKIYWILRRTPLIKKLLDKKFSLTIKPAQMQMFIALEKIGDAFYKNLETRAIEYDHPMTPREIYAAIDDFIAADKELYLKYNQSHRSPKPLFHLLFHP